jgi:hypothetical protein
LYHTKNDLEKYGGNVCVYGYSIGEEIKQMSKQNQRHKRSSVRSKFRVYNTDLASLFSAPIRTVPI